MSKVFSERWQFFVQNIPDFVKNNKHNILYAKCKLPDALPNVNNQHFYRHPKPMYKRYLYHTLPEDSTEYYMAYQYLRKETGMNKYDDVFGAIGDNIFMYDQYSKYYCKLKSFIWRTRPIKDKDTPTYQLQLNGSKKGIEIVGQRNMMMFRFLQHGSFDADLICAKSKKHVENLTCIDPLTQEELLLNKAFDLHHPKFTEEGSHNKSKSETSGLTVEPSNLIYKKSLVDLNDNQKIELLSCLPLHKGEHILHHSWYKGSQTLAWWDAYWDTGNGHKSYLLTNAKAFKAACDLVELEDYQFKHFLYSLY